MFSFSGDKKKKALDISTDGLRWVELGFSEKGPEVTASAFESLPEGLLSPSFNRENIADKSAFRALLEKLIPLDKRSCDIALSIPDPLVRVLMLDFESLPHKPSEIKDLILWRVKKQLPIKTEDAHLDYSIIEDRDGKCQVLAAVAARSIIREYEDAVRALGMRPVLVDISSINILSFFMEKIEGNALFVDLSKPEYAGIAMMTGNELSFFRSREIDEDMTRVYREIETTLNYCSTRMPDVNIDRIYLSSGHRIFESVSAQIKVFFPGEVLHLNFSDLLREQLPFEHKSPFSAAIGAAMRLKS